MIVPCPAKLILNILFNIIKYLQLIGFRRGYCAVALLSVATGADSGAVATASVPAAELTETELTGAELTGAASGAEAGNAAAPFSALACCFFPASILNVFTALLSSDLLSRMTAIANTIMSSRRFTLRGVILLSLAGIIHY